MIDYEYFQPLFKLLKFWYIPQKHWFDGASLKMANTHSHEMEKIIKDVV
jgi:hypothetical protein